MRSDASHDHLNALRHACDVIRVLVARDYNGRYKSTMMGMLWTLANPMLFLLTFYIVFTTVIDLNIPRYASYVFVGIIGWMWTQASLVEAVASISGNPSLVSQPRFPVAALPVAAVMSSFINLLLSLPILVAIIFVEGGSINSHWLAIPAILIVQFTLILGVAYFLAAFNVVFRDIQYILPILLQLGYFVTPIFYDVKNISSQVVEIIRLNPMFTIVSSMRSVLLYDQPPDWSGLAGIFMLALIILWFSFRFFSRASLRFLEEI